LFQVKSFRDITLSVINYMKSVTDRITDFNIGSVARTMIEGPASEIDELYQKMFIGLKEAIPVAIYQAFQFDALTAISASGNIRVTITPQATDTIIPASTSFRLPNNTGTYTSQNDVTITAGASFGDVFVVASMPGTSGNITALQTFTLSPTVQPVTAATNLAAFNNGLPEETEEQRKVRFAEFVAALNHGTVSAIHYGLKLARIEDTTGNVIEAVRTASVVEPYLADPQQPVSLVNCYIHNGSTGASSDLLALARKIIHGYYADDGTAVPGWKAAGVKVEIYAAAVVTVAVTGEITVIAGYDEASILTTASSDISDYIAGLEIGAPALLSEIVAIVMAIDGVYNFTVSLPAGDTAAASTQKLMPGTLTITAA
jgi:hypothetical protein